MAGIPPMKDVTAKIQDALYYEKLQPALRAYLTKLREDAYIKVADGYVDTGHSANETQPVETASAKEIGCQESEEEEKEDSGKIVGRRFDLILPRVRTLLRSDLHSWRE